MQSDVSRACVQENRTEEQELRDRVSRMDDEKYAMLRQTLPEHLVERRENLQRRLVNAATNCAR